MIRLCVGHYHKSIVCKRNAEESLVALNTAGGSAASDKLLGQLSFTHRHPGFLPAWLVMVLCLVVPMCLGAIHRIVEERHLFHATEPWSLRRYVILALCLDHLPRYLKLSR